jgi:hypothetical protein
MQQMGNSYEVMVRVHKGKDNSENLGVGGVKKLQLNLNKPAK